MAACVLYVVIIFSNCIERFIPYSYYLDELLFFLFLGAAVIKACVSETELSGWNRYDVYLALSLVLFLLTGAAGTVLNGRDLSAVAMGKDILLAAKFFACYLCGKLLFVTADRERILEMMRRVTRVAVTAIFICGIISIFVNIGMGSEIRFGLRSYQFLYAHYTFLVYAEVVMAAVLCTGQERKDRYCLVMAFATMLLTLRTKAVVFCLAAVLVLFLAKRWKKIRLRYYFAAGVVGLAAAWGKISQYLSWGYSYNMRNGLYVTGMKLAAEYFPLGVGFAGFGSNLSYEYDPQIYYDLGLSTHQGFETGSPVLSDVFWPYIYGEFGVIGLLLFIGMLVLLFFSLKQELADEPGKLKGANLVFIYLLVASTAEAVFTNSTGVFSAVLLALYFRKNTGETERQPGLFMVRF